MSIAPVCCNFGVHFINFKAVDIIICTKTARAQM